MVGDRGDHASSSAGSGTADRGPHRPRAAVGSRGVEPTGLLAPTHAPTASAKAECRNVITLRTVFGVAPWRASPSRAARRPRCSPHPPAACRAQARRGCAASTRSSGDTTARLPRHDQAIPKCVSGLIDGPPALLGLGAGRACSASIRRREASIRLAARKPLFPSSLADLAEPAVEIAPISRTPTAVVGAVLDVDPAQCRAVVPSPFIGRSRRNCTPFAPRDPRAASAEREKPRVSRAFSASGRQDLNLRPPGPQPGALPDCATPRDRPSLRQSLGRRSARPASNRRPRAWKARALPTELRARRSDRS